MVIILGNANLQGNMLNHDGPVTAFSTCIIDSPCRRSVISKEYDQYSEDSEVLAKDAAEALLVSAEEFGECT